RPGDALILGKPLGIGIYSAALKRGQLPEAYYAAMLSSTTQLNTPGVALARDGIATGASERNWASYGTEVTLRDEDPVARVLLTDPQTSGGLLAACAPDAVDSVLAVFRAEGFEHAARIGQFVAGPARVTVR